MIFEYLLATFLFILGALTFEFMTNKKKEKKNEVKKQMSIEEIEEMLEKIIRKEEQINLEEVQKILKQNNQEMSMRLFLQLLQWTRMQNDECEHQKVIREYKELGEKRESYVLRLKLIKNEISREEQEQNREMIDILLEMEKNGISMDSEMANIILNKLIKVSTIDHIITYFHIFLNKKFSISIKTCKNINYKIIEYCSQIKDPHSFQLVEENIDKIITFVNYSIDSQQQNSKINFIKLYMNIMDYSIKFDKNSVFIKLLQDFNSKSIQLDSNLPFQVLMIKWYGQKRQFKECIQIYNKLKQNKVQLNEQFVGTLIDSCVKCRELQKGLEIIEMEKDSINISTVIYTTILKGYSQNKELQKAQELLDVMKRQEKTQPNIVTYNAFINCCLVCQDFKLMENVYNDIMMNKIQNVQADFITHSTYMKGLFKNKQIIKAINIYNYVQSNYKAQLDEVFYNSVLDGLVKNNQLDLADQVHQQMLDDHISLSIVTYSILMKLYMFQGKIDKSLQVFYTIKLNNIKPGIIIYNCVIQTLIKTQSFTQLKALYQEIKDQKQIIDSIFFQTLILGYLQYNKIKSALLILLDSVNANIVLKIDVYNQVLFKVINKFNIKNSINKNQVYESIIFQIVNFMNSYQIQIYPNIYKKIAQILCVQNLKNFKSNHQVQKIFRKNNKNNINYEYEEKIYK